MFAGLDYGTSNSAIGTCYNSKVELLTLSENDRFLPSTLYTYERPFICEFIANNLPTCQKAEFQDLRRNQLNLASSSRYSLGFEKEDTVIFFGKSAIKNYIESPEEGTFIKSPKSFLGATGLSAKQSEFFEDLVTAMLLNIKKKAENQLQSSLSKVVIGRPVNYQGLNSELSNRQAIQIMTSAALRCGYKEVEFLYEPVAAGVDFETQLGSNKTVLVVDIGGGTTDCSMVKMGPAHLNNLDRKDDILAHAGQRVGGNDLDISLAFHQFTPLLGKGSLQEKGIEIPSGPYWSAVSTNHIGEQTNFNSLAMKESLVRLKRNSLQPELLQRLITLQNMKLNHRLVRTSELAKIELTETEFVESDLSYIENSLGQKTQREEFENAINKPIGSIQTLIKDCIKQSQTTPDIVYVTGGSAKSPVIKNMINNLLPNIEILDGDYYGSVASGLTKWARRIWQ